MGSKDAVTSQHARDLETEERENDARRGAPTTRTHGFLNHCAAVAEALFSHLNRTVPVGQPSIFCFLKTSFFFPQKPLVEALAAAPAAAAPRCRHQSVGIFHGSMRSDLERLVEIAF